VLHPRRRSGIEDVRQVAAQGGVARPHAYTVTSAAPRLVDAGRHVRGDKECSCTGDVRTRRARRRWRRAIDDVRALRARSVRHHAVHPRLLPGSGRIALSHTGIHLPRVAQRGAQASKFHPGRRHGGVIELLVYARGTLLRTSGVRRRAWRETESRHGHCRERAERDPPLHEWGAYPHRMRLATQGSEASAGLAFIAARPNRPGCPAGGGPGGGADLDGLRAAAVGDYRRSRRRR
jgi:hypothetical protein